MEEEKEVCRFQAVDKDGRLYVVVEWQQITFRRDSVFKLQPMTRFALFNGEDVHRLDGGAFEIVANGIILRKVG
jgi:hypothetical protein